jgi:hypothetical protein
VTSYWMYMSTNSGAKTQLQELIKDAARLDWQEATEVSHFGLALDSVTQPMKIEEERALYAVREA